MASGQAARLIASQIYDNPIFQLNLYLLCAQLFNVAIKKISPRSLSSTFFLASLFILFFF
jgi:hypothetical protein